MNARFAIVNPCPKKWTDLQGDGRERYCDLCKTSVHAIEQYSAEEWDQIWRESDGHTCGLLAGDSLPEPRSRRAVLVGALLTTISPLMAATGRVRIRVMDATGTAIASAEAWQLGADDKPTQKAEANSAGEITLTDLPLGNCRIRVFCTGFQNRILTVTLRNSDEVKIDTSLDVGTVGGPVLVEPRRSRWRLFR